MKGIGSDLVSLQAIIVGDSLRSLSAAMGLLMIISIKIKVKLRDRCELTVVPGEIPLTRTSGSGTHSSNSNRRTFSRRGLCEDLRSSVFILDLSEDLA